MYACLHMYIIYVHVYICIYILQCLLSILSSLTHVGLAYRICLQDAMWDTFINVTQCQSIELMVLSNILDENQDILANNLNNETRDMTVLFDIREVEAISVDVSNLTNVSTAIVPNDIHTTNNIVNSLIR